MLILCKSKFRPMRRKELCEPFTFYPVRPMAVNILYILLYINRSFSLLSHRTAEMEGLYQVSTSSRGLLIRNLFFAHLLV